ncbi:MAG: alpha/beta hydrolase [bacterium]|nr:alpha/beta hydrolase [bacterium]
MPRKSNQVSRVLLLPALATDRNLYRSLLAALPPGNCEIVALRYGASRPGEGLSEYVRRQFLEQFPAAGKAAVRFDLVIGTSLGGMAAQELIASGLVSSDRLILISTCFSGRDLTRLVRIVSPVFSILPRIPRGLRRLALRIVAWLFPIVRRGVPDPAGFTAMTARADVDFLFASGTMIANWRLGEQPLNIAAGLAPQTLHIHGTRDPVLSFESIQRQRPPEIAVPGGDHILILTRAPEIAESIVGAGFWK